MEPNLVTLQLGNYLFVIFFESLEHIYCPMTPKANDGPQNTCERDSYRYHCDIHGYLTCFEQVPGSKPNLKYSCKK